MNIVIRKPVASDAFDIRRIQAEGWLDNNLSPETGITEAFLRSIRGISLPPNEKKIEETVTTIEKNEGGYFVATDNDAVVGWIMSGVQKDGTYGFGIYTDRKYRGMGIGSKLMNALLSVGNRRFTIDVTNTNTHGIRFYEKHGFKVVRSEKHYMDDEKKVFLPVVIMQNYE